MGRHALVVVVVGAAMALAGLLRASATDEPAGETSNPKLDTPVPAPPGIERELIGRSSEGRPIQAIVPRPLPRAPVLVVGCIHGDECAGTEVVRELVLRRDPRLVALPNLNPDGARLGTRTNARGVDLNRNFGVVPRPGGAAGDLDYPGVAPFSEPETRAARRFIRRVRPRLTIWFHQQAEELVRGWGPSSRPARVYARHANLPFVRLPWIPGGAPNWQHARMGPSRSFVVETAHGPLSARELRAHVAAVLAIRTYASGNSRNWWLSVKKPR